MSLIYKKGNETATLKDMIKMFPDCWNYAIDYDAPFWVEKDNLFNIIDLIAEITDAFDDYIVSKQLDNALGNKRFDMNECEFENYIEQNPIWGYEDGSIDYDDIYAVLKCYNTKEVISW